MSNFLLKWSILYFINLITLFQCICLPTFQIHAEHRHNFNFDTIISSTTRDFHIATDSSKHKLLSEILSKLNSAPKTIHIFPQNWNSLNIFRTKHHNFGTINLCGIIFLERKTPQNLIIAVKSVFSFSMDTLRQKIMYKNRFHIFHLASNADEVSDMFSTYKSLDGPLYEKTVYGNRVTYFTLYKYSHIFILILGQTATASKTFYICAHCGVKLIEMEFSQNSTHARKYFSTPKFKVATISVMDNFYSAKFICEKSRESRSFTAVIAWEVFCYKNITLKSRHELNQDPFMPMIYTEHVM